MAPLDDNIKNDIVLLKIKFVFLKQFKYRRIQINTIIDKMLPLELCRFLLD